MSEDTALRRFFHWIIPATVVDFDSIEDQIWDVLLTASTKTGHRRIMDEAATVLRENPDDAALLLAYQAVGGTYQAHHARDVRLMLETIVELAPLAQVVVEHGMSLPNRGDYAWIKTPRPRLRRELGTTQGPPMTDAGWIPPPPRRP